METRTERTRVLCAALAAALTLIASAFAVAAEVRGIVVDAWTESPLGGVEVVADGLGLRATTDDDGAFVLDLPDDVARADLWLLDGSEDPLRYVGITPERPVTLRVLPPGGTPGPGMWWGLPAAARPDVVESHPVRFPAPDFDPLRYTVGTSLPTHIRVGRRFASTCSGNPVQRIDTVPLEEYVEGVLVPEIGVFRSIAGGPESSRAVFEAFAVAARSYAVWFYLRDPDAEYHIDDTACNQRYEEVRNDFVRTTVEATAGQILVARSDATLLDKLEYAASCGRHGTRPEYQESLVPDVTGTVACVGSWCGHNNCAGHEVNPALPDSGRCLVRGICQWGSAERSMRGDSYRDIIAHYQPNLQLLTVGEVPATASLVGFVRADDVFAGPGVPNVTVRLDTGATALTGDNGYFALGDVTPGERTVEYSGPSILTVSRVKLVEPGITNWASQAVQLVSSVADPDPDADAGTTDAGDVGTPDSGAGDTDTADIPGDVASGSDSSEDVSDTDSGSATDRDISEGSVDPLPDAAAPDSTRPSPVDSGSLRAVSIVGPEGVRETGCSGAGAGLGWFGVFALIPLVRRRRRCR